MTAHSPDPDGVPATDPDGSSPADPGAAERVPANVTALVAEAMTKSGIIWICVPGDRDWPVWHAWTGESTYVVNGPGEQRLPWLPPQVDLILRSQDTGGRLISVRAQTRVIDPADPEWTDAAAALLDTRLNAPPDTLDRWRDQCTISALTPFGGPLPNATDGGRREPPPSRATTGGLRPAHLFGRPRTRRGTR